MSKGEENPGQASGDRLHIPVVQASGDQFQKGPAWLIFFFEEGLSGEPPFSHNVVVEQPVVEARKGNT